MVLQPWPVFVRPRADVENGSRHLAAVSTSTDCRVRYPWIRTLRHYLWAGIVLPGFFFSPRLTSWLSFGSGRLLA